MQYCRTHHGEHLTDNGGSVARANRTLRRAAGEAINEAATEKGPVDLGDVAVTGAYDLDAEYLVNAAAMSHYGDGLATAESIREGARVICEEIAEFEPETLEDVRFAAYADDEYEAVRTVADEVRESA